MKKTIVILIILIQCTALYSAHIYVNGEILNFRDYPNGNKIGMLNLGTKLSVLEEKGDWVKVRIEGWVYKPLTSSVKHETVQSINYEIISQYTLSDIKKSYNIRLNNKVSEDVLTKIAYEIKNSDKTNYDRIYICYYLPGWETDSGAWATTHFNPGLEVKILGLEKEETEKLYKNSLGNNVICWGIFEKLGCKIEIINKKWQNCTKRYLFRREFWNL